MEDQELPRRLSPTVETARELYLKSGNECAFPGCAERILSSEGVLVGELAHIRAAAAGGPRFDERMSNEDRRAANNLMLLCANHHKVIDRDADAWPVQALTTMKARHESKFATAPEKIRESILDVTETDRVQRPANLGRLLGGEFELTKDELEDSIDCVVDCFERIGILPHSTREVLALIVNRGTVTGGSGPDEIRISAPRLERLVSCSHDELRQELTILREADIGWFAEDWDGDIYFYIGRSTPGIGWALFSDINGALADPNDSSAIRRLFVDLDLTELDA